MKTDISAAISKYITIIKEYSEQFSRIKINRFDVFLRRSFLNMKVSNGVQFQKNILCLLHAILIVNMHRSSTTLCDQINIIKFKNG